MRDFIAGRLRSERQAWRFLEGGGLPQTARTVVIHPRRRSSVVGHRWIPVAGRENNQQEVAQAVLWFANYQIVRCGHSVAVGLRPL